MPTQILIDSYDFTNDVYNLPVIDITLPEWGQVEDFILNSAISLELPINTRSFFDGRPTNEITVEVISENLPQFTGFIDNIIYYLNKLTLQCKSYTSLLFNGLLGTETAYVIENAYPIDIVNELLTLAGLSLNSQNYQDQYYRQRLLDLRFNVAITNLNYAEVLTKLCEVTCGLIYQKNDEFIFEMFNPDTDNPSIEILDSDWITYPVIETYPILTSVYNGVDVKFSSGILLYSIENPTKLIDMSTASPVYTSRIDNAEYIHSLYDYLGTHRKNKLNAILRKPVADILRADSVIEWNGIKYELINLNASGNFGSELLAESIV